MKVISAVITSFFILNCFYDNYPQNDVKHSFIHRIIESDIVDKYIKESNEYLNIDVIYPQMKEAKCDKINLKIEEYTLAWLNDIRDIVKTYYGDNLPAPGYPFQARSKYKIERNDKSISSFYIDYFQYTGGAHGLTTRKTYTIDKDKCINLKLSGLFKEGYNYNIVIDEEIKRQILLDKGKYFDDGAYFKGVNDNNSFYLKEDSIVIVYGLYEIAPYVAGIIEFEIPLNKFTDNFKYGKIE